MSGLTSPTAAEPSGPFRSLIAAWSMVIVVLAVAGFSARWSYYYNFGLQTLVLEEPLASLPIHAIEILRNPQNLVDLGKLVLEVLLPFEVLRLIALWAARRISRWSPALADEAGPWPGPRLLAGGFLVDAVRAGLIVYIALLVGGVAGARDFQTNVVERTSRLPTVAAILPQEPRGDLKAAPLQAPIWCDTRPLSARSAYVAPQFVGDPALVQYLSGGAACSSAARTWRLLYRDEKFVYLFATVPNAQMRPETIALPHSETMTVILR